MAMNLSVLISGKDALSGMLRTVSGEMQMLKANAEGGTVSGASLAGSLGKISTAAIAAATAIAAAVAGITAFGNASLQTAQDFEMMEAKMKTAVRSTALAKQMMAEAMEFAKKTPFDVKEVVDATVRLENYGLAAEKWLPLIGDMAGSMGRSMTDAVEAVADALNSGEFERMKEFGINTQTLRDFGWTGERTAQGMLSLRDALKAVMEERFAGGMDNMMDTTAGKVSNLGDAFTRLKLTVGDMLKPTFEAIVEWATKLTEALEELVYKYYLLIYGPDAAEKFKAHADEARNARGRIRELDEEIKILNAGLEDTETAEEKAARKLEDLGEKAQEAAEDVADANASLEKTYADNAERITDAEDAIVKAQEDAAEATSRAAKRVADAQKDIEKAVKDKADRIEEANKRIADAERGLEEQIAASSKRVADAYDNVIDAQQDLEKAERNTAETRIKLARELQETIEDAEEKIRDTKERTADQVERAEDRLRKAQERQWERNTPMSEQQRKMYEMQKYQREVEEAQQDVLKARQEQADAIAEATAEGAEKVTEKRQSIEEKLFSLAEREAELKERLSEATTAYNEALEKQADDIVKANERISEAVSNLAKVVEQADERIAEARERLQEAEENYSKTVADGADRIAEAEKRLSRAHEDAADRVASAIDRLNNAIQKMADADKALADYEKRQADKAEIESNIAARNAEKEKIQKQMQTSEQQYQEAMKDPELGRGQKLLDNVKTGARGGYEIGKRFGLLGGAIGAGLGALGGIGATMADNYNNAQDRTYGGDMLPGGSRSRGGSRVRVDLAPGLQGKINDANARINTQINNTQAARNVTPAY